MCIGLLLYKQQKAKNKMLDKLIDDMLVNMDYTTLNKLKKMSEDYITYTIDFKQVNNQCAVKNQQKRYALLLEKINSQKCMLAIYQKELNALERNNIKSTFEQANENIDETITKSSSKSNKKEANKSVE